MKGLEREVSDPLKTKIRALKTDMIRIQDVHNDVLICLTIYAMFDVCKPRRAIQWRVDISDLYPLYNLQNGRHSLLNSDKMFAFGA